VSHAPKQRALEAYAEQLLSPPARARVEAHLVRCASCRAGLSEVRAYALLREQAAAEAAPEPSWEQLERALERAPQADRQHVEAHARESIAEAIAEARQPFAEASKGARKPAEQRPHAVARPGSAGSGRMIAIAWPLLAVAATLVIAWLGASGVPDQVPSATPQAARAPVEPAALALVGRVTLIAGAASLSLGDHSTRVDLHTEIREGSLLVTERDALLHVALGAGTGFVLGPESRLRVVELRAGRTRLELVVGSVANQVEKLAAQAQYRVLTGDIVASVRGTRFLVEQAQGTRVAVQEGLVEVTRGGKVVALLSAGQSFEAPQRGAAAALEVTIHELARALGELRALHLPPLPQLRNWRIDGAALSAQGELSMRMPPGIAQLSFEDMRGQVRTIEIDVNEAETRVDPLWLAKLVAPKDPPRSGHLEPEQIAKVIKAGLDPLRRCYERSLRVRPGLEARLTLSVRVGPDGRVQRAAANGAQQLPQELEQCLASETGRLLFPKPEGGGSMSFEVPINLKAK
jgi:hypothetical protein